MINIDVNKPNPNPNILTYLLLGLSRREISVPDNWDRVHLWLSTETMALLEEEGLPQNIKRKCPEIPILVNYGIDPPDSFWERFPTAPLPTVLETSLDKVKIYDLVMSCKKWTIDQYKRAYTVIENLKYGAPTYQKENLPSLDDGNCPSAITYGKDVTDCVATWVKSGFAAGPFVSPPVKNFRCNSLLAVPQENKVRPVLNVSSPKGRSMNDNIDLQCLETVRMTSAKSFGYSIYEAGRGAIMSKFDIVAAYKQMPAKLEDYRLQGFRWLNRFFIETKQIFGAITSVSNFDQLGKTVLDITLDRSQIPKKLVHRQLDDVPVVGPKFSGWCEEFSSNYEIICAEINLPLAPECPKKEKAFKNETVGKVLGIEFDTNTLSWRLPEQKIEKILRVINEINSKDEVGLHEMQVLMGNSNTVSMMSPFLNVFKRPLNV